MKTLSQIVEEEEVMRRNKLRTTCTKQIEAAIRGVEAELASVVFIATLFCYPLGRCRTIVKLVKNNVSFLEAELLTEERADNTPFIAYYFKVGTAEDVCTTKITAINRNAASRLFEAMYPKCALVSLKSM